MKKRNTEDFRMC